MKLFIVKKIHSLIGLSLVCLAFSFLTSVDIMILSYGLLGLVSACFIFKTNWRTFNLSSWVLVGFFIAIQLSLYANVDTIGWSLDKMFRGGIYLFSILFIVPISWYFFKDGSQHNKIKVLIYALCIGTLIATIYGLFNLYTDYGFTKMKIRERNGGMFYELLSYAYNLSFSLIILIGVMLHKYKTVSLRLFIFLCIVLIVGLFTTYSRGPWLSFICAVPFLLLPNKKYFAYAFIFLICIGGTAYFIGQSKLTRENVSVRYDLWRSSVKIMKERPLLGNGFLADITSEVEKYIPVPDETHKTGRNYQEILDDFTHQGILYNMFFKKDKTLHKQAENQSDVGHTVLNYKYIGHAHSNFFQILANTGIIGSVFFITWIVFWFFEMYKRQDIVARITLAFIVCFVVGGLTQSTIIVPENLFFIMIVYAISQVDIKHVERIMNKTVA